MAVLRVQPHNPLKAGIMIHAFEGVTETPALLVLRHDRNFPVTDLHKLAEGFVQAVNHGTVPSQGLSADGDFIHFDPKLDRDALYLMFRNPANAQTAIGSNAVRGVEFRLLPGMSETTRDFLTRRLTAPGVMQALLDSIDMAGKSAPKPAVAVTGPDLRPA